MFVYLIGAGPGDPGLITHRGMQALSSADVVVHDFLAADDLLSLARKDAEYIYVGKTAGAHTMPQADINKLLVKKARAGKIVARLKGGDPYIFGRGGEEAEELADAGVPFEVIPGISSTIAGPAYAGIPLTHRGYASSLTIVTGHEDPNKPDSVHNWSALAKSGSTLVFVMGMKNLPDIAANLMQAGLAPDTPAALIHWATTPYQRSLVSTLDKVAKAAVDNCFTNPSLIVIGQVIKLRDKLNWFEHKPLFGRTVVITRSREQASESASMFKALGARVIQLPTISIRPLEDYTHTDLAIRRLSGFDWLVFTSANGVKYFFDRLEAAGLDARALSGARVAVIGSATGQILQKHGIRPDLVPEKFVAEELAQAMIRLGMDGRSILLARAEQARDVLPDRLRKAGAHVTIVPVYVTLPSGKNKDIILQEIDSNSVDCITFGSSSTVRNFMEIIPPALLKQHPEIKLACIGPITADALKSFNLNPDIIPPEYTIPSLGKAVAAYFDGNKPEAACSNPSRAK